jgi:hypothetical protein
MGVQRLLRLPGPGSRLTARWTGQNGEPKPLGERFSVHSPMPAASSGWKSRGCSLPCLHSFLCKASIVYAPPGGGGRNMRTCCSMLPWRLVSPGFPSARSSGRIARTSVGQGRDLEEGISKGVILDQAKIYEDWVRPIPAVPIRQAQGRLYGTGPPCKPNPGLESWAKFGQSCPNLF